MSRCDYPNCRGLPYAEVYYKKSGKTYWSYLCKKHFKQEVNKPHIMTFCELTARERFKIVLGLL